MKKLFCTGTQTLWCIAALLVSIMAYAQVQNGTVLNSRATGATNTAVVATLGAVSDQRAHLYQIEGICSAGTANILVQDGGTTIWSSTAAEVTTTRFVKTWTPGLTGSVNTAMTITLSACGVGNTGTLTVAADRW